MSTSSTPAGMIESTAPTKTAAADLLRENAAAARRRVLRSVMTSSPMIMLGVLVALFIAFSIDSPNAFPTTSNVQNIALDASTLMVMAVGMTFVMTAGGFDISVGSVLVFANVIAAKVMVAMGTDSALTIIVGLLAALAAGAAWGIFNGVCIAKLGVPALITTLGTFGAALGMADLITGGNDVRSVPPKLITLGAATPLGLSWIVWVALFVVVVGGLVLYNTRFGRRTALIGSNAEAARRAGINVTRYQIGLYGLVGLMAGLAGMLSLAQFATTTISGHTTDVITVIEGVALGGTSLFGGVGTVTGTVVGILIPTTLNNGLVIANVQPFWQQVAIGYILILAVYLDQRRRKSRERV